MKSFKRKLKLSLVATTIAASYTLAVQGTGIALTPGNPSVLAGQAVQLTANGAVTPTAIAVGAWHTCVMYTDQSIRCTGLNNQGEIGNNDYHAVSEPTLAIGTVNPVVLRTGNEHTCSFVGDGRIQCWGTNYTGQLGDGTIGGFAMTPQFVHNISGALKLITGGFHTCAILADSTVQCWGRNQDGQIGNGDATTDVALPVPVGGLGPVVDLVGGGYHNCARKADNSVHCWGRNARGQVGDGTVNSPITEPHLVSGLTTATALSLGGYHSCALLADATVQCWGESDFGQIGTPGMPFSSVPVTVDALSNVLSLGSGFRHTCARLADSTVRCWGQNDWGQLGDGTTTRSATPITVPGITGSLQVGGGWGHTCVLMPDTSVRCWGDNTYGQLGNGTSGSTSPTPVVMHLTGLAWTSSQPSIATVDSAGVVTGVARGTATISVADPFGNSGSVDVAVKELVTLGVIRQGDGGGTVTSAPAGVNCPAACSASFVSDSQVTLTAAPDADSLFSGWTGCDSVSGATCTVTMANARSVNAIFPLKRVTLTASKTGAGNGTVTSSPAGINCGTACASDVVINTTVTLTAAPGADSLFSGWTGCDSVSGATCTVTMANARSVNANFMLKLFTMTVSKSGTGSGTVTSSPAGITCGTACANDFVVNTTVTLTAAPGADSLFSSWTGCDSVSGATCTVTVASARSVNAVFTLNLFTLTVTKSGTGNGTVTSSPTGINCGTACASNFVSNTTVTLTASPGANSLFSGWTGCTSVSGATCTVTMANARSVNASFTLKVFSLTVTKTGLGNGTVTSSPAGVNCGADCGNDFVINTTVTLTATPALLSVFTGWTGCDAVNGNVCTVQMTSAKTVSANFLGLPLF
jgi:alpha-tubulin suppressor-like RCC1 family protein